MASDKVLTLTAENFDTEVIHSSQPVLVDFWAEWCGPCKMIGPLIDELAAEYDGRVKIGKVNVDNDRELSNQYKIQSIPALMVFKGGEVRQQTLGLKSKGELMAMLDDQL